MQPASWQVMAQFRNPHHPPSGRGLIRLAPGTCLSCDGEPPAATLLVSPAGKVRLNQHALAILALCDGSRSRTQVVVGAVLAAAGMRAADVAEFLDAALARGWIIESD